MVALDGLRAVAVLAVVAHHAELLPFRIGARGVELFFVLSGFCLSLGTLERAGAGLPFRFDRGRFAIARALRILPPYYAALVLFIALSATSFGYPTVATPPAPFEWFADFLLMTTRLSSYNASFWSLAIEARWYLVFPAVVALYVYSKRLFGVLAFAAYGISFWQPGFVDAGTLPCFMLGIVAADLFVRGKTHSLLYPLAAAALLAVATVVDRTETAGDPLWHLAAFAVVLSGLGAGFRVMQWQPLAQLGTASYSIYLIHQPVLCWLSRSLGMPEAASAVVSIAAGVVFWRLVELPAAAFLKARTRPQRRLEPSFANSLPT